MVLPMNPKEYENWTKTRAQGGIKYAVKTALFATIATFLVYFIANGFVNLANIDKYIAYNISIADQLFITLFLTFILLAVAARILFAISEKRYAETTNKNQNNQ